LGRLARQEVGEILPTRGGQGEFLDVLGSHAVEPVEAGGVVGGHPADDGRRRAALGQERGAGEGVRPPA
jgi:hypothetical protein